MTTKHVLYIAWSLGGYLLAVTWSIVGPLATMWAAILLAIGFVFVGTAHSVMAARSFPLRFRLTIHRMPANARRTAHPKVPAESRIS